MAALGVGVAGVVAIVLTSGGVSLPGLAGHGLLSARTLPRSGGYSSLALVDGRLIVWGDGAGESFTQPESGSPSGRCQVARVVPATLALTDLRRGACADPALYGERVLMLETVAPTADHGRIESVRVSRETPGGYHVGPPVLARLTGCTGCDPIFTYGDGALWIELPSAIGVSTTQSELLQISERTGRLVRRWSLPALDRPWLAADRDGLWLAPSGFDGTPNLHPSAAEVADSESLYRVTPGARSAEPTFRIGTPAARWLLASSHSVWLETATPLISRLVRLNGPAAHPVYDMPAGSGSALFSDLGPTAQGLDEQSGVATLGVTDTGALEVLHLGPHVRRDQGPRGIGNAPSFGDSIPGVLLGQDFFFLDPPATSTDDFDDPPRTNVSGAGVLYRVGDA